MSSGNYTRTHRALRELRQGAGSIVKAHFWFFLVQAFNYKQHLLMYAVPVSVLATETQHWRRWPWKTVSWSHYRCKQYRVTWRGVLEGASWECVRRSGKASLRWWPLTRIKSWEKPGMWKTALGSVLQSWVGNYQEKEGQCDKCACQRKQAVGHGNP